MTASCDGGTCDASDWWFVGDTRFEGSAAACDSFRVRSTPELPCAGGRGDAVDCPLMGDALSEGSATGCKSEGGCTGALVIASTGGRATLERGAGVCFGRSCYGES